MGKISVNIQREDRLKAIVELSTAIRRVAEALVVPVHVNIEGCHIQGADVGVKVGLEEEVKREIIIKTDEEE